MADEESGVETKPALGALPATGGKESLLGLCAPKEAVFFYFLRNSLIPERQSIKKEPSHSAEHFCAKISLKRLTEKIYYFLNKQIHCSGQFSHSFMSDSL